MIALGWSSGLHSLKVTNSSLIGHTICPINERETTTDFKPIQKSRTSGFLDFGGEPITSTSLNHNNSRQNLA